MKENSKVLALKYRPKVFEDLIGQDVIRDTILSSIIANKTPNAYLFTGIRGVGKTTTARLVAKALNCKNGIENLCKENFCESCEEITNSNSLSVLAVSEENNLFFAPDTYMEKIAIGPNLPNNLVDLDNSVEQNISLLADAKNTTPSKITVCVLDRPRHEKIISSLKQMKVNLKLISDGDVSGIIYIVDQNSPVDIYIGIGGGPEGVLAAAALSCYGGQIQTRLVLDSDESVRAKKMGITDLKRKYNIDDMIKGDVMFCATAITDGELANGIKVEKEFFEAQTLAMHKSSNINTLLKNKHLK